jgi:hypothetical protein
VSRIVVAYTKPLAVEFDSSQEPHDMGSWRMGLIDSFNMCFVVWSMQGKCYSKDVIPRFLFSFMLLLFVSY